MYARNLTDPGKLRRFNDGIIQASILRKACAEELSNSIDNPVSQEMRNLLLSVLENERQEQGEALLEFLFAISIEKLYLKEIHVRALLEN